MTIMCEVEGVLNCRPITKLNNCIEDWRALTPISLLAGNICPDSPVREFNKSELHRSNYKYVVAVSEQFWSRWIAMYVLWLQIRHRWHEVQPKIDVGDLVLLLKSQTEGRRDNQKT